MNGDGDRTGFSVVETGTDQLQINISQNVSTLAGYVSAPEPPLSSGDESSGRVGERCVIGHLRRLETVGRPRTAPPAAA